MTRRKLTSVIAVAMAVVFATTPVAANAQVSNETLRAREIQALRNAQTKRRIIDRKSDASDKHAAELRVLEARIDALTRERRKVDAHLADVLAAQAKAASQTAEVRDRLEAKRRQIGKARKAVRRQELLLSGDAAARFEDGNASFADLILGSRDLGDAVTRISLVTSLDTREEAIVRAFEAERAEAESAEARMSAKAERLASKERKLAGDEDSLRTLRSKQDENLRKMWKARGSLRNTVLNEQATIAKVRTALKAEQGASAKYAKEIRARADLRRRVLREAAARRAAARRAAAAGRRSSRGGSAGIAGNGFLKPLNAPVTSPFGFRIHPIYGYRKMHTGVDFGAGSGTPIRAAQSGTVFFAGSKGGYGQTIEIRHANGVTTLYAHMSGFAVRGGRVSRGQVIGYVGSTGASTGPHLHFETRVGGSPVNPMNYL